LAIPCIVNIPVWPPVSCLFTYSYSHLADTLGETYPIAQQGSALVIKQESPDLHRHLTTYLFNFLSGQCGLIVEASYVAFAPSRKKRLRVSSDCALSQSRLCNWYYNSTQLNTIYHTIYH